MKPGMLIGLGLLVAGAVAFPWVMKNVSGLPMGDKLSELQQQAQREESTRSSESTRKTYYKWQDSHGTWSFGENPPEGVKAIAVNVDTAANIIRSEKLPTAVADPGSKSGPSVQLIEDSRKVNPLTPVTNPAAVVNTVEQAQAVQELLNQRSQVLQQQSQ